MNQDSRPNALDPAGPFAAPLADLSWTLFVVTGGVTLVVLLALALAVFGGDKVRRLVGHRRAVVLGGFAFPVVVLTGLLVYGLIVTAKVSAKPAADALRIRVTGEMWWWRIQYLDGDRVRFETANEVHIPVGRPVVFDLQSADVIHSFWVPQLGPKLDMIPGRINRLQVEADRAGVYRGQCAEYCGGAHALMAFEVVAQSEADYADWVTMQAAPVDPPTDRGWTVFADSGCGACHMVRGTEANGRLGPDLTHIASRRTLAAPILPNDLATRHRFIAQASEAKPGLRMPDYTRLSTADLDALNAWLDTLQ